MCILKTENEKRRKNERSVSLVRFFRALKSCRLQGEQTGTAVPAPFGLYASTPKKCLVKDK